jgi:hypothetical protein
MSRRRLRRCNALPPRAARAGVESLESRVLLAGGGGALPRVTGVEYDTGSPVAVDPVKYLVVHFDADVGQSLDLSHFHIRNVSTGTDVTPAALRWDPFSQSAVIEFASPTLAEGNYTLTLTAAGISDIGGNPLDGDGDGQPGGNYTAWFSELPGDANGDHTVNFTDLLALAKNYNGTGQSRPQGDFNSDRVVNFADLLVLSKNYNRSLPRSIRVAQPDGGSSVSGIVDLTADLSDTSGLAGVQFMVNGAPVGAEDTSVPYTVTWDSTAVANGTYQVTAVARGTDGTSTASEPVSVTVANTAQTLSGQWSDVMNWPLVAINTVLLKDGRVLMWDGDGTGAVCIGPTSARVWDPATNTFTPVPIPYFSGHEDDIFCSAQTLLADGRVLVVGGHDCDGPGLGIKATQIFDPATMTWTRGPDMNFARWYPTATTLSDGRVLILGGSTMTTVDYVDTPEIYDPVTNTISELPNATLSIPSYSFVFQHPDGRVIVTGSDEAKMPTYALDVATQTWSTVDPTVLDAGSGVMYRPGKFLKAGSSYLSAPMDNGGSVPSKATTYVLDTTQAGAPKWQQTASMANARTHLNLTILPDGTVLATGGSSDIGGLTPANAVYPAELWNPATQTWSTLPSMQTPRMYHSTATLLPDGRILVAGGGRLGPDSFLSAEIYSPAYLFRGPRPVITSAPSRVEYGSDFFVATPDAARIASVALLDSGATTHSFNMNQRYVPLTYEVVPGGLRVHAPADSRLATPGEYMLFVVDSHGVPSVAPFVRLPAPYEDIRPPTAPTNLAGTGSVGTASLTWTAATDNVGVVRYNIYRGAASGFAPGPQNLIGTSTTTAYADHPPGGTYYYVVQAVDQAGNLSPASGEAAVTVLPDTVAPTVAVTGPANGATVKGVVTLSANASDDVAVAAVRFLVDGVQVGGEDTTAPYSISWNSRDLANGLHTLTAVARDGAGNSATSDPVSFTIANTGFPGLVASYSFDEGSGTVADDSSGNGLNGSISNATWTSAGKFGGALSFNGTSSIVDIADADALDLTAGMTLEAWVRPTALSGYRTVILKEVPGELAYSLYASNDSSRPNTWGRIGGTSYDATGTASLPLNTWTHLASTYDGTTLRLYVNGVQVASRTIAGALQTSANMLHIGGNAIWGEYFAGLIDEVRIYNHALTAAQIQSDMNAAVAGAVPDTITLAPAVAAALPTAAPSPFNVSVPIDSKRKPVRRAADSVLLAGESRPVKAAHPKPASRATAFRR